jgi:DNA-binding NarL/FixJ family response regulator
MAATSRQRANTTEARTLRHSGIVTVVGPRTQLVEQVTAVLRAREPESILAPAGRRAPARFRKLRGTISSLARRTARPHTAPYPAVAVFVVSALKSDGTTDPAEVTREVREIRSREPHATIYVLLDERNPEAVRAARQSGATDYLGPVAAANQEAVEWRVSGAGAGLPATPEPSDTHPVSRTARFSQTPARLGPVSSRPSPAEVEAARERIEAGLARLPTRADAVARAAELVAISGPELRSPESGRLDAKRIAARLGVSVSRLAPAVRVSQQALSARPDSLRAQAGLLPVARVLAALDEVLPPGQVRMWLNAPQALLGGEVPLESMLRGGADALARRIEGALEGLPD